MNVFRSVTYNKIVNACTLVRQLLAELLTRKKN
jgi:hypothetical protein